MGAVSDVVAALWVRISYLQFHTIKHREQRRVMNMEKHASSLEKANHASPLLCLWPTTTNKVLVQFSDLMKEVIVLK